jgi:NCS2 family nucleobase:cation symporter-2
MAGQRTGLGIGWTLHGDGRAPAAGQVVAPEERLSWPRTIGVGAQHVIAMFGATFLVPLLTGFPPATTLFFSGVGTMLFLVLTAGRVPSYLGSSFAFIAPIAAAKSSHGMAGAVGGIFMAGVALFLIGLVVQLAGTRWLTALMPPAVTGAIVALIGLNLAPAAKNNVVVGYAVAMVRGEVSFEAVGKAAWIGLPEFTAPSFHLSLVGLFVPVVLVLVAENIGHVKSVALMTDRDLDPVMGRALMADGLATTLAGTGGGSGTTTYAENIGVMAATRIYSTAAYWVAAIIALLLSFSPKFGQLIATVPQGVLGGAGVILYGMIGLLGVRIWVQNRVDFGNPINLTTAAIALIIGIADFTWKAGDLDFAGIALGTAAALVTYHLMTAINRATKVVQDPEADVDADLSVEGTDSRPIH